MQSVKIDSFFHGNVDGQSNTSNEKKPHRLTMITKKNCLRFPFNVPTGDQHIIINDIFYNVNYIINHKNGLYKTIFIMF